MKKPHLLWASCLPPSSAQSATGEAAALIPSPIVLEKHGEREPRFMRYLLFTWKYAAWNFILFGFLLFSAGANGQMAYSTSNLNFGSVPVGSSSTLPVTIRNNGKSDLTILQITVSGTEFSFSGPNLPLTLTAQQSASLNVTFTPQVGGSAPGNISISSWSPLGNSGKQRSGTITISLSATGLTPGYLTYSSSTVNFGGVPIGSSQTQSVTLTNSGGSVVTISQAAISGSAGFSLSGFALPSNLAAGASLTCAITFTPTLSGTASGALTVTSNASDAIFGISLSGNGSASPGQLTISPPSIGFGTVPIGTSQSQTGMLGAIGSSVTISSDSSSNSQFTLGGIPLPVTIAAGQSLPFTVIFAPQASGLLSATISFVGNASNSTVTGAATGTGEVIQHTVALSWNSSSSPVTGYNVYRSGITGGPYTKINSSLDSLTAYSDETVQAGQNYFYVTTAVDSSGMESGHSNEVAAQVPIP